MKWLTSLFGGSRPTADGARLERYKQFRELGRALNLDLIKQLPPPALPECGKKLGLYKSGTLILNQDDEIAVAYDYCLHHYRRAGKNTIQRARDAAPPAEGSAEMEYLDALAAARFSLFRVEDILPHEGARLLDLVAGDSVEIMDMSLISSGTPGLILAGRLLSFDGFAMSSGTFIPIPEPVFETRIQPVIRKFMPELPADPAALSPAQSAAFEAQVLRIALNDAGEHNTFFTDIEV